MTIQDPATPELLTHVEQFRWRVLQDALTEATAAYWERRADTFTQVGNPRCDQIAQACRHKAAFLRGYGLDTEAQAVIAGILTDNHGQVS